jgi:hypothetical protein
LGEFQGAIEGQLAEARDQVSQSQRALEDSAPENAGNRVQASQEAMQAVEQAAFEVGAALDEARQRAADQAGETAPSAGAKDPAAKSRDEGTPADTDSAQGTSSQVATSPVKGDTAADAEGNPANQNPRPKPLSAVERSQRLESGATNGGPDSSVANRRLRDDAWLLRLPAALQQSIRTQTRPAPPRGYEERLRRYFESE